MILASLFSSFVEIAISPSLAVLSLFFCAVETPFFLKNSIALSISELESSNAFLQS